MVSCRGTRAVGLFIGFSESVSLAVGSFLLSPDLCLLLRFGGFVVVIPSSISWVSSCRADESIGWGFSGLYNAACG